MQIMKVDPRALKENPDRMRQSKSSPQADALMLATIKAVGIVQPPVVAPEPDGGNGYIIDAGHRRVRLAIAAGSEEVEILVVDAANDNGAMRSMVENSVREALNPVDQWRGVERLVALGWTEEAIAVVLALPVRQIRKLRLLANVLPATASKPHPENAHQAGRTRSGAVFGARTSLGYLTEAANRGVPLPEAMQRSVHKSVTQASGYYNNTERKMGGAYRLRRVRRASGCSRKLSNH
ncbi:putative chromosome-partitioning protein ParB [Agrobacterium rosae]|uniref:Putative chromosome-partitioning protein ParB n=1 Tax=Agrobacterium rosae TaxID=1972867 RepID=A0A1R3U2A9_9HYPH|nr:putative chromosome-partitioning protein ParB [Agrobacterium rosae]